MKSDREFLKHVLDEILFVTGETKGMTFDDFMKNETLKRACTRSLEIIGEAVKNLSADFRKKHMAGSGWFNKVKPLPAAYPSFCYPTSM